MERVFSRLKKARIANAYEDSPSEGFGFTKLPYELQIMIARECALSPVSILVGLKINPMKTDPEVQQHAQRTNAILATCKDFSQGEVWRLYYENNIFELGYYFERLNFFQQPGTKLVRYVMIDFLRLTMKPIGSPGALIDMLKQLPSLQQIFIRIRDGTRSLAHMIRFQKIILTLCRDLATVREITLLIEGPTITRSQATSDYQESLDSLVRDKKIRDFLPRDLPTFTVRYEYAKHVVQLHSLTLHR